MSGAAQFLAAHCACGLGAEGPAHFLIPVQAPGADAPPKPWRMEPNDGAEPMVAPPPTWRIAVHEMSHAAVSLALGRAVNNVTVIGQPMCVPAPADRDDLASASFSMAGPHGETLVVDQRIFRPFLVDVMRSVTAVREFRFGGCDACSSAFAIVAHCGYDALDDEVIKTYRAVESATIELLHGLKAPIRTLAERLLAAGTIDGDEARRILEEAGVAFGSLKPLFMEVFDENA